MSKIVTKFSNFLNEGLSRDHIINNEDANLLFELEEDNLSPNDEFSDEDYNEFLQNVIGKTIWEYCLWRYPDEPEEQFELVKSILRSDK